MPNVLDKAIYELVQLKRSSKTRHLTTSDALSIEPRSHGLDTY